MNKGLDSDYTARSVLWFILLTTMVYSVFNRSHGMKRTRKSALPGGGIKCIWKYLNHRSDERFDQEEQGRLQVCSCGDSYFTDTRYTRQHAFVHSGPFPGGLTEEKVNLVIIRVVSVCDRMSSNKLGLCGDRKQKPVRACSLPYYNIFAEIRQRKRKRNVWKPKKKIFYTVLFTT